MARLVEVQNIPADVWEKEGFTISPSGVPSIPAVEVTAPRLREVQMDEVPLEMSGRVPYSGVAEGARSFASGLTFGSADELEAAMRSAFSDEEYKAIRDRLRAQQAQFGQDYPKTQLAAEVVGGLALPAGVLGSSFKAGQGLFDIAKAGSKAGAVAGGLGGVGVAKEVENIPMSAISGTAGGAAIGGVAPVALNLSGQLIRNAIDATGLTNASEVATRKLKEYFAKENLNPNEVQDMLDEYRRLGVPDPVIADVSAGLRGAGYAAQIVKSPSKSSVEKFLEDRQQGLASSVSSGLQTKSGVNTGGKFGFDYVTDLAKTQEEAARKAYPLAYSKDVTAVPFRKYADRELFIKAYNEAKALADVKGINLPELSQLRNAQYVSTELLHQIKRGLDRVVEQNTDALGKVNTYGNAVQNVREEFNDLIKYHNKDYAKANAKFADSERLKSAYQDGLDYMKIETSELISKIKSMNKAQKQAFRVGMISDISNRLSKFRGQNPTREVFLSDRQKKALKYAFDDESQFNDFIRQLDATTELVKTFNRVRRGSTTAENISDIEDEINLAESAFNAATGGGLKSLLRDFSAPILSRAKGYSSESSDIMKQSLFNPNPIEQRRILESLNQQPINKTQSGFAGATGGLLGNLQSLMLGK